MNSDVQYLDLSTPQGQAWAIVQSLGWRMHWEMRSISPARIEGDKATYTVGGDTFFTFNGERRTDAEFKEALEAAWLKITGGANA